MQQFLGLANYYNEFIRGFAEIASPLSDLLSPKAEWIWGEKQEQAFELLKEKLCNPPVLRLPDFTREFHIEPDALDNAVGAVLL